MFPHPTCTKDTRSNNHTRIVQNGNQHSDTFMIGMGNIQGSYASFTNPNEFYRGRGQNREMSTEDFLRTQSSSIHQSIDYQHDHYIKDPFSNDIRNQPSRHQTLPPILNDVYHRTQQNTRDIGKNRYDSLPVQSSFQSDYMMQNFETFNQFQRNIPIMDPFMENRNPTNTQRDRLEKQRLQERKEFLTTQGGNLHNFVDLNPVYTRKERNNIQTNQYVPMPRTLALPKDKL